MNSQAGRLKVVVCTTPIRPVPTDYPPFGSLAVIQALRSAGYDPYFYDIDGLRPSLEEVERFFAAYQPDVVGISAVVSTAYAYTKKLARMLRRVCPQARIVLGGNLAASAEILHRLAGVHYCVSGEGELVSVNLLDYLRDLGGGKDDYARLGKIPGLSFLDEQGRMTFTGYERRLLAAEFPDPDWTILEKSSRIENFITSPFTRADFAWDPRSREPRRAGKKMATVVAAKGCVARCTFCHRWDKGYRPIAVDSVVRQIKLLQERYDVGFIQFSDENFGSDKRQFNELIEAVKPLDILFDVAGVRCRTVDPDMLRRLRDAGCVSAYFGMETGSPRILQVMEKNLSIEHNMRAARWTAEAGLYTIYQLVLGMPGENDQTIRETTEFFKQATEFLPESPLQRLSINYIQALPGTPVYEYARHKGLIGKSLADEEKYLELISDIDAGDEAKFLNFTDWDYLTVQTWRRRIIVECLANYMRRRGIGFVQLIKRALLRRQPAEGLGYEQGGYFNLHGNAHYAAIAACAAPLRLPLIWTWLLLREWKRLGSRRFFARLGETLARRLNPPTGAAFDDYRSLRKVVDSIAPAQADPNELAMAPFRAGR